ncbi:Fc.00g104520.m01.CDS01 [Cosmosporella sp. VM-42]
MVHIHVDPVTGEKTEHDGGANIYGPGETWFEAPGCHHVRSECIGDEDALFIANMVVSDKVFERLDPNATGEEADLAKIMRVVVIDKEVEEQEAAATAAKRIAEIEI